MSLVVFAVTFPFLSPAVWMLWSLVSSFSSLSSLLLELRLALWVCMFLSVQSTTHTAQTQLLAPLLFFLLPFRSSPPLLSYTPPFFPLPFLFFLLCWICLAFVWKIYDGIHVSVVWGMWNKWRNCWGQCSSCDSNDYKVLVSMFWVWGWDLWIHLRNFHMQVKTPN